ncbi:CD209 antigen-like protein C [Pempheris klunzingeri]|uniref:CD209 antigen-like protein C n=1 Tax=Pempheris klunzingeri TaxID=3127111 RepID=UPI00397F7297
MSVKFDSKSGEVGGGGWSPMDADDRSNYGSRSQSPVWWIGAVAVCLGLLLLSIILGMVALNSRAINQRDTKFEYLIYNLTKDRDAVRDERNQLKIHSNNLTKELLILQSQYNSMAASRDELQREVSQLNLSRAEKTCLQGWVKFNNKCYYVSPNRAAKTWEMSRKDCQERGADLVIITTKAELDFVKKHYDVAWIGLSDKQQEGKWKWVDGSDLEGAGFWQEGEPNDHNSNEDCVEVSRTASAWNDASCDTKFSWICED